MSMSQWQSFLSELEKKYNHPFHGSDEISLSSLCVVRDGDFIENIPNSHFHAGIGQSIKPTDSEGLKSCKLAAEEFLYETLSIIEDLENNDESDTKSVFDGAPVLPKSLPEAIAHFEKAAVESIVGCQQHEPPTEYMEHSLPTADASPPFDSKLDLTRRLSLPGMIVGLNKTLHDVKIDSGGDGAASIDRFYHRPSMATPCAPEQSSSTPNRESQPSNHHRYEFRKPSAVDKRLHQTRRSSLPGMMYGGNKTLRDSTNNDVKNRVKQVLNRLHQSLPGPCNSFSSNPRTPEPSSSFNRDDSREAFDRCDFKKPFPIDSRHFHPRVCLREPKKKLLDGPPIIAEMEHVIGDEDASDHIDSITDVVFSDNG